MNGLDIVILVTVAVAVVGGLASGIVKSLINLAGLLAGLYLAIKYYETVGGWLGVIDNVAVANIIGFALIVFACLLIAAILCRVLRKLMSAVFLVWLDHLLGGFVGLLMGILAWRAVLELSVRFFTLEIISDSWVAQFILEKLNISLFTLTTVIELFRGLV